ncbi:MAG: ATP-dependent protease [Acidimicrobiia bacterium]
MSTLAKVQTVTVLGIQAYPATVEVHIGRGLPQASVVGLADTAVREARDRVKAAFESSGLQWPRGKIVINLAPADLPKAGAAFDLPIAAAIAVASGIAPPTFLEGAVVVGELGLDGGLKRCRDILPIAAYCRQLRSKLVFPVHNSWEVALVEEVEAVPVEDLSGLVSLMKGESRPSLLMPSDNREPLPKPSGEERVGEAEIASVMVEAPLGRGIAAAAAGMLNIFLWGPPGSGKTLIGRGFCALLPDLDTNASLQVRMIHSLVSDRFDNQLPKRPPFRGPHHTVSPAALVGGGGGVPRPGEVSLAHHGVLFLDELALFSSPALDALRQPLEDGVVRIARAKMTVEYPARPMVVAATNTCPCGASRRSQRNGDQSCRCSEQERVRFLRKISGPFIDRFDLALHMHPPDPAELLQSKSEFDRRSMASMIEEARALLAARTGSTTPLAWFPARALRELLPLRATARSLLERWAVLQRVSARRIHKMMRLSWALSALDGAEEPELCHVEEALSMFVLPAELSES